jgi:hypothetical protein
LMVPITCTRKQERTSGVSSSSTRRRVQPAERKAPDRFLEVIASVPIKPVPRPVPPNERAFGAGPAYSRFTYEVALQEYAIAQLRGKDEDTKEALRRRLPPKGWRELGFVPFALVSYEETTVRSARSEMVVQLRIDRADPWSEWSTMFGSVAVRCRPAETRFRLITAGTDLEAAPPVVADREWPMQRAAKAGLIARLCGR